MTRADGIAWSRTASSSKIVGDLPPSSSVTRFMVSAPSRMIFSPTAPEPVNEILATSGLRTSSAPTTLPRPVTTFKRPFGRLVSCSASSNTRVCSELNSLGLMTTVQPAATAEASFRQMNSVFAFHAVIRPATPTGSRVTVVLPFTIGAHQHEMAAVGVGHQHVQKVERGGVRPLHVVDEDDDRMRLGAERPNEFAEQVVEPVQSLGAADVGDRRLRADDELEVRQHVGDDAALGAHRGADLLPQGAETLLALGQQGVDQVLEGLDECDVGRGPPKLVELAAAEISAPRGNRLVHLVDERRLARARVATDEDEQARAVRTAVKGAKKRGHLRLASIHAVREAEDHRGIFFAEGEQGSARAVFLEVLETTLEVVSQAVGGLVSIVGALRQKLVDDGRERRGYSGVELPQGRGDLG